MKTDISQKSSRQLIAYSTAVRAMLLLPAIIIGFHLLIIAGIIPYSIVWGGRLTNNAEMLRFESISIAINLLVMLVVAMEAGYIRQLIPPKVTTVLLWALFGLFVANTVANLFSVTTFEKVVFTPLTLLFALFTYRILQHRREVAELMDNHRNIPS